MATFERKTTEAFFLRAERAEARAARQIRALAAALRDGKREEAKRLIDAAERDLRVLMQQAAMRSEMELRAQLKVRA